MIKPQRTKNRAGIGKKGRENVEKQCGIVVVAAAAAALVVIKIIIIIMTTPPHTLKEDI